MVDRAHTYIVVLAGGGGTRLWPKSREATPKQFLKLFSGNTLMQDAVARVRDLVDPDHIIVISNKKYVEDVKKQLPYIPEYNIIGEPEKRETAPAMLLGALIALKRDPEAVVLNQASDHVVTNVNEFLHVSRAALQVASEGKTLVTVGILPTYPNTGFGYIKIDQELRHVDHLALFSVSNFTEKPNEAVAKAFISTGKYFWNANNYVWKASALVESFEKLAPHILSDMQSLIPAIDTPEFKSELERVYSKVEKITIDYAISEKADNLVLIPGDFGWDDVGSWSVVHDLRQKNEAGNAVIAETESGDVVFHDSKNNLIHTHGRLVALVGINDMVVVDTGEIVLVMPKARAQDVKKIVDELKQNNPKYL